MNDKTRAEDVTLLSSSGIRTIRTRWYSATPYAEETKEAEAPMGEVRAKIMLTNGVEEAMARRGLIDIDEVHRYETDALVDTGAVRSVLPLQVLQYLGLGIVRKTRARYANDASEDVDVSEVVGIELIGRRTTEEMLILGSEVIIGQTVLESLDLLVDCLNRHVIPNPAHPDGPVIKIKGVVGREMPRVVTGFL